MTRAPRAPGEVRCLLLLSVQRALLGAVPAHLRQVSCGWNGEWLGLRFIFDGPIGGEATDAAQIVSTEVIADFPDGWMIEETIERMDYPEPLAPGAGTPLLAYRRKE